jgi:hypothetical protein
MTGTPRRLLLGLVLAALVATGACAKPDATSPTGADPTGVGAFGGPGSATGVPPAATQSPPPKPPPVTYPNNARAYAEAVLTAWRQRNTARLGQLTTPEVYEQIVEIPGPPDLTWAYWRCDGAAGSSYCQFFNNDGDAIVLRVSNQLLGKQRAVNEVRYPYFETDGIAYVREFVEAWRLGHRKRMQSLAVPAVVDFVKDKPAPRNPQYDDPCCGGGLLRVVITNSEGFQLTLDVGTLKLGSAHAIVGYVP